MRDKHLGFLPSALQSLVTLLRLPPAHTLSSSSTTVKATHLRARRHDTFAAYGEADRRGTPRLTSRWWSTFCPQGTHAPLAGCARSGVRAGDAAPPRRGKRGIAGGLLEKTKVGAGNGGVGGLLDKTKVDDDDGGVGTLADTSALACAGSTGCGCTPNGHIACHACTHSSMVSKPLLPLPLYPVKLILAAALLPLLALANEATTLSDSGSIARLTGRTPGVSSEGRQAVVAGVPFLAAVHLDFREGNVSLERDTELENIHRRWRARPSPQVRTYNEFLVMARRHRDGPKACARAIASMRLAALRPAEFARWQKWHEISRTLSKEDNFGGYGRNFGNGGPKDSPWGGSAWGRPDGKHGRLRWDGTLWDWSYGPSSWEELYAPMPKTPQKKKQRRARLRERRALDAAARAEFDARFRRNSNGAWVEIEDEVADDDVVVPEYDWPTSCCSF
ncbi:hypothetical protein C8F04DRAFT_1176467 [Mycena alexandri]|uniref:Uncharacterized protein n=1 Tax=Mycena alexandri TaxID=1745969 RepID=A0AAD6TE73_9AGAR|nr:hypothetical protein C8F04DRAFT_1176467 [Mycena alexandri]